MKKTYIDKMILLVKDGIIEHTEANDRVAGFIEATKGRKWDEYRAAQRDLVESGLAERKQANARLQGFRDAI